MCYYFFACIWHARKNGDPASQQLNKIVVTTLLKLKVLKCKLVSPRSRLYYKYQLKITGLLKISF